MIKKIYGILPLIVFLLSACEKKEPEIQQDGVSVLIQDLEGDINGSVSGKEEGKKKGFDTFLFNFREQKQIWLRNAEDSARWLKTDDWDLAFTKEYNCIVFVNNANDKYNPGFEGDAKRGAVLMVDKAYGEVDEAPSDAAFDQSDIHALGQASNASTSGWFFYNQENHIMVPIKNRTWVIRLADGKYAKLELINVYKGNPPVVTDMFMPTPYFTFRYYVQEDGSKNLRTR